jgi:hypothetical protein
MGAGAARGPALAWVGRDDMPKPREFVETALEGVGRLRRRCLLFPMTTGSPRPICDICVPEMAAAKRSTGHPTCAVGQARRAVRACNRWIRYGQQDGPEGSELTMRLPWRRRSCRTWFSLTLACRGWTATKARGDCVNYRAWKTRFSPHCRVGGSRKVVVELRRRALINHLVKPPEAETLERLLSAL